MKSKELLIGGTKSRNKINISVAEAPRIALLGATGSGKTVLLWNLVIQLSIIFHSRIQFIGIDLKQGSSLEPLKNRLALPIITEPAQILPLFQKLDQLMMDRNHYLGSHGLDKIDPFSDLADRFPMVIVICEELISLMNNPETHSSVNKALRDWFVTYLTRCRSANMGIIISSQSFIESLTIPTAARGQLTTRFLMRSSISDVKILAEGMEECCPAHLLGGVGQFYLADKGNYSMWQQGITWETTVAKAAQLANSLSADRRDLLLGWSVESPF